jgi:hypothetical protein
VELLPVVDGLTLKIIVLYFKFNFFLPLIFTFTLIINELVMLRQIPVK